MIAAAFWFIVALGLALCAGAAHIVGLQTLLPGLNSPLYTYLEITDPSTFLLTLSPVILIGIFVELGKLGAISWMNTYFRMKRYWAFIAVLFIPTFAAIVLTSIGVFGYLSKGNIAADAEVSFAKSQIPIIEAQIEAKQEEANLIQAELNQITRLIDEQIAAQSIRAQGGAADQVRAFRSDREELGNNKSEILQEIADLKRKIVEQEVKVSEVEAELGPAKFLFEFLRDLGFYDNNDDSGAVRLIIFLIVMCMDPMAMCLLIAAQIHWRRSSEANETSFKKAITGVWGYFQNREQKALEKSAHKEAMRDEEVIRLKSELQQKYQDTTELREQYEAQIREIRAEYEGRLDELHKEHRQKIDEISESVHADADKRKAELDTEYEAKEQTLKSAFEIRENELTKLIERVEGEKVQLFEQNQEQEKKIEQQNIAIQNMHSDNDNLRIEQEKIKSEYEQMLNQSREEMGTLKSERDELVTNREQLIQELNVVRNEFASNKEENENKVKELEQQSFTVVEAYDKKIDELGEELEKLGAIIDRMKQEHHDDMNSMDDAYQEQQKRLKEKHNQDIAEMNEKISDLESDISEHAEMIANLPKDDAQAKPEEIEKLNKNIEDLNTELVDVREQLRDTTNEYQKVLDELKENHQKEIDEREEEFNKSLSTMAKRYEEQVTTSQDEREKLAQKVKKEQDKLNKEVKKLKDTVAKRDDELKEAEEDSYRQYETITKLEEDIDELNKIITDLQKEIDAYKELPRIQNVDDLIEVLDENPPLRDDFVDFVSGTPKLGNAIIEKFNQIKADEKAEKEESELVGLEITENDLEPNPALDNTSISAKIADLDYSDTEKQETGEERNLGPDSRFRPDPPDKEE